MCKDCCAQRLKQVVIHISGVPSLPKMFAFMPQPSNLSLMQRCQLPYDYFLAVCSVLLAQKQCILKPCILYNTNKKPHAEKKIDYHAVWGMDSSCFREQCARFYHWDPDPPRQGALFKVGILGHARKLMYSK